MSFALFSKVKHINPPIHAMGVMFLTRIQGILIYIILVYLQAIYIHASLAYLIIVWQLLQANQNFHTTKIGYTNLVNQHAALFSLSFSTATQLLGWCLVLENKSCYIAVRHSKKFPMQFTSHCFIKHQLYILNIFSLL